MPDSPPAIDVAGLTKDFGEVRAVDDLSFTVPPGKVIGFLGPNGAGKTTTLRCLLGLVTPTAGGATIGGRRYADWPEPMRVVGGVLEASGFHPSRSARNHLRVLCAMAGLPAGRADEVLADVGLGGAARRKVAGFSLGMRQRLALAAALLGDPGVLILDEPANGLDPEGIAWLRTRLRGYAAEGRTVLVSSHVLSEVAQTVDEVVIIARGRLVRQAPLAELAAVREVRVRTPEADRLRSGLARPDVVIQAPEPGLLVVTGLEPGEIGVAAQRLGIELEELTRQASDLERVFLELTEDAPAGGSAAPGRTGQTSESGQSGQSGQPHEGGARR